MKQAARAQLLQVAVRRAMTRADEIASVEDFVVPEFQPLLTELSATLGSFIDRIRAGESAWDPRFFIGTHNPEADEDTGRNILAERTFFPAALAFKDGFDLGCMEAAQQELQKLAYRPASSPPGYLESWRAILQGLRALQGCAAQGWHLRHLEAAFLDLARRSWPKTLLWPVSQGQVDDAFIVTNRALPARIVGIARGWTEGGGFFYSPLELAAGHDASHAALSILADRIACAVYAKEMEQKAELLDQTWRMLFAAYSHFLARYPDELADAKSELNRYSSLADEACGLSRDHYGQLWQETDEVWREWLRSQQLSKAEWALLADLHFEDGPVGRAPMVWRGHIGAKYLERVLNHRLREAVTVFKPRRRVLNYWKHAARPMMQPVPKPPRLAL